MKGLQGKGLGRLIGCRRWALFSARLDEDPLGQNLARGEHGGYLALDDARRAEGGEALGVDFPGLISARLQHSGCLPLLRLALSLKGLLLFLENSALADEALPCLHHRSYRGLRRFLARCSELGRPRDVGRRKLQLGDRLGR